MPEVNDRRRISLSFRNANSQLGDEELFSVADLMEFCERLKDADASLHAPVKRTRSDMQFEAQGLMVEWDIDG